MATKTVSRLRSRLRRLNKARLSMFDVVLLILVGQPSDGKLVSANSSGRPRRIKGRDRPDKGGAKYCACYEQDRGRRSTSR